MQKAFSSGLVGPQEDNAHSLNSLPNHSMKEPESKQDSALTNTEFK